MNLPNSITAIRIVLSPIFVAFWYAGGMLVRTGGTARPAPNGWLIGAFVVVVLAEASDLLDGRLARRWRIVTNIGKLLDPFADTMFRFTAFLCFLASGLAEIWMLAIIFYRDITVAVLRNFGVLSNVVIAARWSGKLKAIVQGTVVNLIIALVVFTQIVGWEPAWIRVQTISWWLMLVATLVTFFSGIEYVLGNWPMLMAIREKREDG
ncbi:MAG: CDP-diacylglycerol--glycerol-3-phosphate 3-phosphatidyltransferase [Verrucomicrobia bacterium]|nr:CDP-diacylglycerol--glycerol-3-phosphate 3-phosphatidyltransferase [Verrucomicrobiota bacterium]